MSGAASEPGLSDFLVQEDLMSLSCTYFLFSLFIFFHSFFPFLFTCRYLYKDDLIPKGTKFIGYARSDLTVAKLRAKTEPFMKVNQ